MSSVLKILVDIDCQVYCDYELKGEATPNSLFRIEMRKGHYILEFKRNNACLLTQEYEMKSNEEEPLLRISLKDAYEAFDREESFERIASLNVVVKRNFSENIFEVWFENIDTGERTPIIYNVSEDYSTIDKCGLLCVNLGGVAYRRLEYGGNLLIYKGGKWGCINKLGEIQIPIIYDKPIEFKTPNIAVTSLNDKQVFLNKWGEEVSFEDKFDELSDNSPFFDGHCIVTVNGKYGIIDGNGKFFLPPIHEDIKRTEYFIVVDEYGNIHGIDCYIIKENGCFGLIDKEGKVLLPTEFDNIQKTRFGFITATKKNRFGIFAVYEKEITKRLGKIDSFHREGNLFYSDHFENMVFYRYRVIAIKDGCSIILDYDGNILLDKGYKMVPAHYGPSFYDANIKRDYHAQIVVSHGKFGCLNKSILGYLDDYDYRNDVSEIQEIVPCVYDYVAEFDNNSPLYSVDKWGNWITRNEEWKRIYYFVKQDSGGHFQYYECHSDWRNKSHDVIIERDSIRPHPDSRILFIDTETTGLLQKKQFDSLDDELKEKPYLVQVALLLFDKNFIKLGERNIIVAPKGYTIPIESTKIHGITNSYALEHGEDRKSVMKYLRYVFDTVDIIIGHNIDFDLSVLDAEFWREGEYTGYNYCENNDGSFTCKCYKAEEIIDTMKLGSEICKIPSTIKGEKYKWPTLDELYRTLFGISYKGLHNALNDVKATYECYCRMVKDEK